MVTTRRGGRSGNLAWVAASAAAVLFTGLWGATVEAQTPSFTLLGIAPGQSQSRATALSADGTTAVGYSEGIPPISFNWTRETGRLDFSAFPGPIPSTEATGVSATGAVTVGYGNPAGGQERAFRFANGVSQVLPVPAGYQRSRAFGVSGDGSITVGNINTNINDLPVAARWTPSGVQNLGFAVPNAFTSTARGISGDGRTIIAVSAGGTSAFREACTWTEADGWRILPVPAGIGAGYDAQPSAINANGTVIVGGVLPDVGPGVVLKWTNQAVSVLPGLGSNWTMNASAVDATGSVVVGGGTNLTLSRSEALLWRDQNQPILLYDYLASNGLQLPSFTLLETCRGVSGDGMTFTGTAFVDGVRQAYVAVIPAPATLALTLLGGVLLHRRRSR